MYLSKKVEERVQQRFFSEPENPPYGIWRVKLHKQKGHWVSFDYGNAPGWYAKKYLDKGKTLWHIIEDKISKPCNDYDLYGKKTRRDHFITVCGRPIREEYTKTSVVDPFDGRCFERPKDICKNCWKAWWKQNHKKQHRKARQKSADRARNIRIRRLKIKQEEDE